MKVPYCEVLEKLLSNKESINNKTDSHQVQVKGRASGQEITDKLRKLEKIQIAYGGTHRHNSPVKRAKEERKEKKKRKNKR